jgi:transcriptional regulator with XRE-family HTH domain
MAERGENPRRSLRKFIPNAALKNFREAARLSQAKLAELARLSQSVIARLESGETRTTADIAVRLAPLLGREPRELFPQIPGRPNAEGDADPDVLKRALAIGRRFGDDDDDLIVEIAGLVYALLMRERGGHPISDDEGTLSLLDDFARRLRRRRSS